MATITMSTVRGMLASALAVLLAAGVLLAQPQLAAAAPATPAQQVFTTAEAARQALVEAARAKDRRALAAIFGPAFADLAPGDPVEEAADFEHFSGHVQEGTALSPEGENKAVLLIGSKQWPFPIPLVREAGGWRFDTLAGRQEILTRRIGHNELSAISVCRAYVEAQREYYGMAEQDGDQIPKYAQHLISRPGRHDGLYWPTAPGMKESPLGPLVAKAKEEGYMQPRKEGERERRPFHGYFFKILKKQAKSAPGGKFDYLVNGNMIAGHALVAYPSRWGVSGVMTFIVNQSGRVYQKNLGPKTAEIARKLTAYNPDPSWRLVP